MSTTEQAPWLDEVLDEDEIENALNEAKRRKYYANEARRERERREKRRQEMTRPWTSDEYLSFLKFRAVHHLHMQYKSAGVRTPGLQIDHENSQLIQLLCLYFTNDKAFEAMVIGKDSQGREYKGDLQKGILLYGAPGTGKTALLKLFAVNKRCCYHVYNVPKICGDYMRDGKIVIETMSNRTEVPEDDRYLYQREMGKGFDDLLREEGEKRHWGEHANVMSQVFFNLSSNGIEYWKIHATLNYPMSVVGEAYGEHVKDRFYEMFNMIEVKGRSRRRD